MLAFAGTGYGLIGILVTILLVALVFTVIRRAWSTLCRGDVDLHKLGRG